MEKLYHKLNQVGISCLVFGFITIIFGIGVGVVNIINGARMLGGKREIMF